MTPREASYSELPSLLVYSESLNTSVGLSNLSFLSYVQQAPESAPTKITILLVDWGGFKSNYNMFVYSDHEVDGIVSVLLEIYGIGRPADEKTSIQYETR